MPVLPATSKPTAAPLLSRLLTGVLLTLAAVPASAATLGAYNVKMDETSISGISSGAYMAVQFGVAWSSIVKGVGAIAAAPYYCAQGDNSRAMGVCEFGTPDIAPLISQTNAWAASGAIDPTANIANQKLWMFNGYNDGVVKASSSNQLYNFYLNYTDRGNVFYKNNLNAAHAHLTNNYGAACNYTGGEFINNCGYDSAGMILSHIYGTLNPKNSGALSGSIIAFAQTDFANAYGISMADTGYVYVPAACAAQQPCRIHIAMHGCKQYAGNIGDAYYRRGGYNEWADSNNLIVLYPQTTAKTVNYVDMLDQGNNPWGCWDIWGYNRDSYTTKYGAQIKAIKAMVNRLTANYNGWSAAPGGSFGAPTAVSAQDSSHTSINLIWKPVAGAIGYNVYRASCAACSFSKVNAGPTRAASFADGQRIASTTYFYKVRAVNAGNVESLDSSVVNKTTAANPPFCDPYFTNNYAHAVAGRAYTPWYNLTVVIASGSGDYMGVTGPLALTTDTLLRQTSSGYFRVGPCN